MATIRVTLGHGFSGRNIAHRIGGWERTRGTQKGVNQMDSRSRRRQFCKHRYSTIVNCCCIHQKHILKKPKKNLAGFSEIWPKKSGVLFSLLFLYKDIAEFWHGRPFQKVFFSYLKNKVKKGQTDCLQGPNILSNPAEKSWKSCQHFYPNTYRQLFDKAHDVSNVSYIFLFRLYRSALPPPDNPSDV